MPDLRQRRGMASGTSLAPVLQRTLPPDRSRSVGERGTPYRRRACHGGGRERRAAAALMQVLWRLPTAALHPKRHFARREEKPGHCAAMFAYHGCGRTSSAVSELSCRAIFIAITSGAAFHIDDIAAIPCAPCSKASGKSARERPPNPYSGIAASSVIARRPVHPNRTASG